MGLQFNTKVNHKRTEPKYVIMKQHDIKNKDNILTISRELKGCVEKIKNAKFKRNFKSTRTQKKDSDKKTSKF